MITLSEFINENVDFSGQKELVNYICDKILELHQKSITLTLDNLSEIKYINFFDKVNIFCNFNANSLKGISETKYKGNDLDKEKDPLKKLYKEYNFNEDTNNLYDFDIYLEIPKNVNISELKGRISHEINHIYTYWNIVHDDFYEHSDNIKVPEEYHNKLHEWTNNIYNKIIRNASSFVNYKFVCGNLLYSLTSYERNAFLCEINMYLFDNKDKINNKEDLDEIMKYCNQYNIYKIETKKILDEIKNDWDKNEKDLLVNTYNEIYKSNKNFNQIYKLLNHKLDITLKKLDKNIDNLSKLYMHMNENIISYPIVVTYNKEEMMMKNYIAYF